MSATLVPCLICGKYLVSVGHEESMRPYRGLMCVAHGNCGSQIFDPTNALDYVAFIVCDACALERQDRMRLAKITRTRPTTEYLDATLAFAPEDFLPDEDESSAAAFGDRGEAT